MDAQKIFAEGPEGSTLRCKECGIWKPTSHFATPYVCKACKREASHA